MGRSSIRVKDVFCNRWLSLISGYLLCAVAGTGYIFSVYAPYLKETLDYQQSQLEFISTLSAFCLYFSPLTGLFFDFFGPRWTSLLGGVLNFSGYFLIYLSVRKVFWTNNILVGIFSMMAGIGCGCLYTAAIGPNQENFPAIHRGKVVGSLVALFGLSAAIFTGLYTVLFAPDIQKLLLFLAIFPAGISLFGILFVSRYPTDPPPVTNSETPQEEDFSRGSRISEKIPLISIQPEATPEVTPLRLFININFWVMVPTFLVATGLGLMTIANIGSIVLSLGLPDGAQDLYVMLLSIFNAVGRLSVGIISDVTAKWINRPLFLTLAIIFMGLAQFTLSFGDIKLLPLGVALTGFAYGNTWGLIPVLTREFYGEKYWGTNLAILGLGSALGSFLFATEMAGRIYQSHVAPGSLDCFGTGCFQMTFWIGAACCVVAALLSLVLYARSRGLYQLIFRLRPTPPKKSIQ